MEHDHRGGHQSPEEQPEQPQNPEALPGEGDQLGVQRSLPFALEDLTQIEQRMSELTPTIADREEHPEFYFLSTKQGIMEEAVRYGRQITPDLIAHHLAVSLYHANAFDHHEAKRAIETLRWGFFAALAQYDQTFFQEETYLPTRVDAYNEMQQAAIQQTGHLASGVTLNPDQSQTLAWMLDQVGVPHTLGEAEAYIPFYSLEQRLREATEADAIKHPNQIWEDHEITGNTHRLIEQWNQQENQES